MALKDDAPLTRVASKILAWGYDIYKYIGDIYLVHLTKKHNQSIYEYKGNLPSQTRPRKIAIVAIYPSDESIVFTKNLLESFKTNDFYILVLSTRIMTASQREQILNNSHQLIERHNIGQDLGSYKHGLHWLEQNGNKIADAEIVTLANDSMFYPAGFKQVVETMVNRNESWQCLFENFQNHHHAQSFFLLFKKEVLKDLQLFWKNYKPYRSRVHAIHKGEIGLSRWLRKRGHFPHSYYSSMSVTNAIQEKLSKENRDNMALTSLLIESYGGGLPIQNPTIYKLRLFAGRALTQVGVIMNHVNPTHTVGLIVANVMGAPIKRDCCYRGFYDPVSILKNVSGFSQDELITMETDLRKKGTGSSVAGWRRLLYARGRI